MEFQQQGFISDGHADADDLCNEKDPRPWWISSPSTRRTGDNVWTGASTDVSDCQGCGADVTLEPAGATCCNGHAGWLMCVTESMVRATPLSLRSTAYSVSCLSVFTLYYIPAVTARSSLSLSPVVFCGLTYPSQKIILWAMFLWDLFGESTNPSA